MFAGIAYECVCVFRKSFTIEKKTCFYLIVCNNKHINAVYEIIQLMNHQNSQEEIQVQSHVVKHT